MEKGIKHKEVEELQKILKIEIDGVYGSETKKCVEELQDHFKIKIDGIIGPETRNILSFTKFNNIYK
jgi:peptidoglycan hydrolase-like protein with peptidoglycan-binding domain